MRRTSFNWVLAGCFVGAGWVCYPGVSESFNDEAHKILSTRAINPSLPSASTLDAFLKNVLGFEFPEGINQYLVGDQTGTVSGWIRVGAIREDQGFRPLRHFHDPTKTWGSAGLFTTRVSPESAVVWSQNAAQGYSWSDARKAYFNALTSTNASLRKSWYAELFRTLGHQIHLVQDAAVPAHTRNDSHLVDPLFGTKIDPDAFHYWADSPVGLHAINAVTEARRFDSSILNQSNGNPLAPIPVARIIDKTDEDFGVLSPNLNIGLAEYSNANFISNGTARSTFYQFPTYLQLEFPIDTAPSGRLRRYARFRQGFGEQDYYVGVSSRMARFVNSTVPPDSIDFGLDDKVHADYGRKLFPRAIGYSAGLIDYFFRGKVDATPVPFPDFVLTPFSARPNSIRVDNVSVNVDGTNEQAGPGTLRLVLLYSVKFGGSFSDGPPVVVSHEVPYGGGTQSVVFPFDSLPFPTSYPAGSGSHIYQYWGLVVYKGPLGQEAEAVVPGNQCTDPSNDETYLRWYQLEHCVPNLWFPEDCAYIQYGC